jgi:putative PIN family toxin of toxin-antitoxin system
VRIILDTSVLIAAFLTRGLSATLLDVVLEHHEVVVSARLLEEYEATLQSAGRVEAHIAAVHKLKLASLATLVEPPQLSKRVGRDRNDEYLVALMDLSQAEYLATFDKDLLSLKRRGRTRILTPRELWMKLRERR